MKSDGQTEIDADRKLTEAGTETGRIEVRVTVGSHGRRSLQLFPKMHYYASPT